MQCTELSSAPPVVLLMLNEALLLRVSASVLTDPPQQHCSRTHHLHLRQCLTARLTAHTQSRKATECKIMHATNGFQWIKLSKKLLKYSLSISKLHCL